MKKLKISDMHNFGIHIEERIEEDNLFFHEYQTAVKKLNNIWEIQKDVQKNEQQKGIFENPNNIIAFCGERGSGKSSVMMSFVKALENSGKRQDRFNFKEEIRNNNWSTQIVIDPSMFDGVHNIVDIVLTHIYYNFHEAYDKDNQKIDQYERQEMLSLLAKTYKSLSMIKNKEKMLDDEYDVSGNISKLQNMGESTQLRNTFEKLATRYLEMIPKLENRTGQKSEKLLIVIDDLDLCNEHAYEMAEQIRKYLILPNVIIFMAIRIEQLEMGVEEKNRGDFRNIIAGRREDVPLEKEMRDMAERYVTKLIPKARRIYLPKLGNTQVNLVLDRENVWAYEETIENKIAGLLREKTGMILIPKENSKNYFVPKNLREFVNLVLFLEDMDYPDGSEQIFLENIYDFHSYFIEEILKKDIRGKRLAELLDVVESADHIINYNMGSYIDRLLIEKEADAHQILYEFPNGSLAAVQEKLNAAAGYLTREEDYQLFYYIKMYYTILLNERRYERKIGPFILTGGFIWGNMVNNLLPAAQVNNQTLMARERFWINTFDAWNAVADTLNNNENLSFNIEKKAYSETKQNDSQIRVNAIKGQNKLPEEMCWLVLALFASTSGSNWNGKNSFTKNRLVYDNYSVPPVIGVSLENYFAGLNNLSDLYWIINFERLGISWDEVKEIFAAIERENAERIRQARIIVDNLDLSDNLLAYCRQHREYKAGTEDRTDRTYHLVQRFFNNVKHYLAMNRIGKVDWTKFWIPLGFDEQGGVYGQEIDICRIYANMCNAEEKILRKQPLDSVLNESNELKQNFSKQVKNIALTDYTKKIDSIPGYLINKTARNAKINLEKIANCIQRYTYKEKKFPDGFSADRTIKLYSDVIDLYMKNPEGTISEVQSNEYKEIAKIKDIIL